MTRNPILRKVAPYVTVVVAGFALVAGASILTKTTNGIPPNAALTDDTVVAIVQTATSTYSDEVKSALRTARESPESLSSAQAAARILIAEGRKAADTRLVGAALGVLRPFMAEPDAQTLYLAATVRQYQHDFPAALAMLDEANRHDSTDVNIVLTRATIQIVLGRFDLAAADCELLYTQSRPDIGFLCQATSRLLTEDAPLIYDRLSAILSHPGALDPSLHGWARGLLGEIAVLQGDRAAAQGHLEYVLAANPFALRERLLLADLLLAKGDAQGVLDLMAGAPSADGVLIRRVLAAEMLNDTETAETARRELQARFAQNRSLGLAAHAREEAMYFLWIANDPGTALQRAIVNWNLQHEIEDAQLLVDAALSAGEPEAAAPVMAWKVEQSVSVPTFSIPDAIREAAK